jgi:hypothetical protein
MALDLKIIQETPSGSLAGGTWPNPDFVDGEYNLIQRVVKNLLTFPGTDLFDPTWGSGLRESIRGIPGQNVDVAKKAIVSCLKKCVDDISQSLPGDLQDLRLETLEYDANEAAWLCAVTVVTPTNATIIGLSI